MAPVTPASPTSPPPSQTEPTEAAPPPRSRASVAAIVFASLATLAPVVMIVLHLVVGQQTEPSSVGGSVLALVLGFLYEVALGPAFALIALVLAIVVRRRGPRAKRNSGIAITILGVGVALLVLQVLLYLPR